MNNIDILCELKYFHEDDTYDGIHRYCQYLCSTLIWDKMEDYDTMDQLCYWRASEASETLSGVYKFELVRYIYIYIYIYVWRYVCHISSACHAYVMWAELGHCHFLYVPAVLNVVTTGNGMGTKNVLKLNRALGFEFSIQSSVYGATTVAKVSLFSTWTRCTVSFYSM